MTKNYESWLKHHEGFNRFVYNDTVGKKTIGFGRNLSDNGISFEEADYLFQNDLKRCQEELEPFEWYALQPERVRWALINMCFNLGLPRLLTFERMIQALEIRNYTVAAMEALDSKWAKQVGDRAKDVAVMINGK